MNIKKAIGAGLLVFAIQFAAMSVLSNTIGPLLGANQWAGYAWQALMVVILVAIVYYIAKWYFTGNTINTKNGLYLGIVLVVVSFIVNILQVIPALIFGQDIVQPLIQYVTSISFLVTAGITVAAAVFAGYYGHKKTHAACKVEGAVGNCMPEDAIEKK